MPSVKSGQTARIYIFLNSHSGVYVWIARYLKKRGGAFFSPNCEVTGVVFVLEFGFVINLELGRYEIHVGDRKLSTRLRSPLPRQVFLSCSGPKEWCPERPTDG